MQYYIDTNIFLFLSKNREKLDPDVTAILADYHNDLIMSSESVREILMLIKNGKKLSSRVRLHAINSIYTEDETVCFETSKWLDDLISKSIQISGSSSGKERFLFFQALKTKVNTLISKVLV